MSDILANRRVLQRLVIKQQDVIKSLEQQYLKYEKHLSNIQEELTHSREVKSLLEADLEAVLNQQREKKS